MAWRFLAARRSFSRAAQTPKAWLVIAAAALLAAFVLGLDAGRRTAPVTGDGSSSIALMELGATEAQWKASHLQDAHDHSSFLPRNLDGEDRFVGVTYREGRVFGFIIRFDPGTVNEHGAKLLSRAELPVDSRLVFDEPKYVRSSSIDDQCDVLQYQSRTIGGLIKGDGQGVVTAVIWSPDRQGRLSTYEAGNITSISVTAAGTLGEVPEEC
jgi:hypothetical protein